MMTLEWLENATRAACAKVICPGRDIEEREHTMIGHRQIKGKTRRTYTHSHTMLWLQQKVVIWFDPNRGNRCTVRNKPRAKGPDDWINQIRGGKIISDWWGVKNPPLRANERKEKMEGQQAATEEEKLLEERAGDGAFVPRSTTPRLALPAACIYGNT